MEVVACQCVPAGKFDPEAGRRGVTVIPSSDCHLIIEDGVGKCVGECKAKGNACKPFLSTILTGETVIACTCRKAAITSLKASIAIGLDQYPVRIIAGSHFTTEVPGVAVSLVGFSGDLWGVSCHEFLKRP